MRPPTTGKNKQHRHRHQVVDSDSESGEVFPSPSDSKIETTLASGSNLSKGATHFRDIFRSKGSEHLRHIVSELRKGATPLIFGIPASAYVKDNDHSKVAEWVKLFRRPGLKKISKFAPIIFPEGKEDMDKIFQALHLPLMAKAILFGKSSVEFDENGKAWKAKEGPPVGVLWGINKTTPGLIALVGALGVFSHSPDPELSPVGKKTEIDYRQLFTFYKKIILRGFRDTSAKQKQYTKMFHWYNSIIFADRLPASLIDTPDDDGAESSDEERAFQGGGNGAEAEDRNFSLRDSVDDWDAPLPSDDHCEANIQSDLPSAPNPAVAIPTPADPQASPSRLETPDKNERPMVPDGPSPSESQPAKPSKQKGKEKAPVGRRKPDPKTTRLARELVQLTVSGPQVHMKDAKDQPSSSCQSKRITRGA
ncbi:hypothetical protein EST38_g10181 [Candolleomyces aberdarensis]|uniref:Uncharacterized protein n=1 Tax=Candolleomyces aberdarensis TaxID=2316362 RepID=A0A4Q2DAV8_9AGAR|nr:hypothetical protein EST38_g10181 [Candolleomyces aberdarensis]